MQISLVEMKPGQSGVITDILGGAGVASRLNQIGLRKGKRIKKISSVFSHGPVTVSIDNYQVAVGYGKAVRILVEVDDEKNSSGR